MLAVRPQMHHQIRAELGHIEPFDTVEREHHTEVLSWESSGAELFRLEKPGTPPKHLLSCFALIDRQHILLVYHRNAQLWLPAGGHVKPQEHHAGLRLASLLVTSTYHFGT